MTGVEITDSTQSLPKTMSPENDNNIKDTTGAIVSLKKRRGLLSFMCLIPEQVDPNTYSKRSQVTIIFAIAFGAIIGPMGSTIFLPAMESVLADIGHNNPSAKGLVNISYGLYTLSLGVFPLWWSNASEIFGRRSIYIVSFSIFLGFVIAASRSSSIGMLMAFRILSGLGASAIQSVGAGTVSDMVPPTKRGVAMGYFYLGPMVGPLIGPIVGGAVVQKWGWRSTQWFLAIASVVMLAMVIFFVPETLQEIAAPTSSSPNNLTEILNENTKKDDAVTTEAIVSNTAPELLALEIFNSAKLSQKAFIMFIKPLKTLKFLTYPPVILAVIYNGYCCFCLFFLEVSLESLYTATPYRLSSILIGLTYLPLTIGYIISSILSGRYSDKVVRRVKAANNGIFIPESRFAANVFFGAILYPLSLIFFGWTAQYRLFWVIPLIASFLFGISSIIIMSSCITYMVDTLPGRGSSGVAINNLVRMTLAATATFIFQPMRQSPLGFSWLYTLWGLLGLLLIVLILSIRKWGNKWRTETDFKKLYN